MSYQDWHWPHLLLTTAVLFVVCATIDAENPVTKINRAWAGGMQGIVDIPIEANVTGGWHMKIHFRYNIFDFEACEAEMVEFQAHEEGHKERSQVVLTNRHWNPDLTAGENLRFYFLAETWKRRKGVVGEIEFMPYPLP